MLFVGRSELDGDIDILSRIFDRIVEHVEHCGTQLFRVAEDPRSYAVDRFLVTHCIRLQVMTRAREIDAFAHQGAELHFHAVASGAFISGLAGSENLFDRAEQTICVEQHQLVEFAALCIFYLTLLQGFQVQANGSYGGLQFMGNRVNEAVVLLVTANFVDEKNCVESNSGNDGTEENDSQEDFDAFAPVDDNPAAAYGERQGSKAGPESQKDGERLATGGNAHGLGEIVTRVGLDGTAV